jgi:hypothetical protein
MEQKKGRVEDLLKLGRISGRSLCRRRPIFFRVRYSAVLSLRLLEKGSGIPYGVSGGQPPDFEPRDRRAEGPGTSS